MDQFLSASKRRKNHAKSLRSSIERLSKEVESMRSELSKNPKLAFRNEMLRNQMRKLHAKIGSHNNRLDFVTSSFPVAAGKE